LSACKKAFMAKRGWHWEEGNFNDSWMWSANVLDPDGLAHQMILVDNG